MTIADDVLALTVRVGDLERRVSAAEGNLFAYRTRMSLNEMDTAALDARVTSASARTDQFEADTKQREANTISTALLRMEQARQKW